MKVAIGFPALDRVNTDFALCLAVLTRMCRHEMILLRGSSNLQHARNMVVEGALAHHADYLLLVDTDMIFPGDTVERLLAHEKDIVGCAYRRRGGDMDILVRPIPEPMTGCRPVELLPTGLMLIKMSVFETWERPWFWFGTNEETRRLAGEDLIFCHEAHKRGYELWCDWDLSKEVGHRWLATLTLETN